VPASQDHRIVVWIESVALLLLIAYLFAHTMPRAWTRLNTDFPNYYMSARLAHEGFDTSREYEWIWLQRQKDHRFAEGSVITLVSITPFSTLVMWPLASLAPLTAKHLWIVANFVFLIPLSWLLRSITGLPYRRIALLFALSFPLHRNLLYGQFYVFLLLLIVAACWASLRGRNGLAGAFLAIAAVCKVFPALLFVLFLRRRNWIALLSGAITGLVALSISVAVFGWSLHRTYLHQTLPWTLRGEALPPYNIGSASISSVLHVLFLTEPQWNPNPWHTSPLLYALLQPALQMLILAPAVLLIRRNNRTPERLLLEWSALLTASLAISTSPASYQFVVMVLPACVLGAFLLERRRYGWLGLLLVTYLGIGFPMPGHGHITGPAVLLYVPRLLMMFALLAGLYGLLWSEPSDADSALDWTQYAWGAAMLAFAVFGILSALHQQCAVRQEFAYRLSFPAQTLLAASPLRTGSGIACISMTPIGYRFTQSDRDTASAGTSSDDLSFSAGDDHLLIEQAADPLSSIVDTRNPAQVIANDAREPMLAAGEQDLAFLRDNHGRGQLMLRRAFRSADGSDNTLTPPQLNVYEASFLSERQYAFSAVDDGHSPEIYLTDAMHTNAPLALGESRYPALSPDGKWMAYSHLDNGVWNLWLRDQRTGGTRRVADVPCNQIQPSWEPDAKTLLYAADCGRGLWLTAVSRRQVIP
jgi:Glycosyltransferase family 87/WD40-like Beta Propeller Repeat